MFALSWLNSLLVGALSIITSFIDLSLFFFNVKIGNPTSTWWIGLILAVFLNWLFLRATSLRSLNSKLCHWIHVDWSFLALRSWIELGFHQAKTFSLLFHSPRWQSWRSAIAGKSGEILVWCSAWPLNIPSESPLLLQVQWVTRWPVSFWSIQ